MKKCEVGAGSPGRKRKKVGSSKHSKRNKKGKIAQQKQQKHEERKAALNEKDVKPADEKNSLLHSKMILGKQPSAGALAAQKKIRREKEAVFLRYKDQLIKSIDLTKLPQTREEQLAYARSMKPKPQDQPPKQAF